MSAAALSRVPVLGLALGALWLALLLGYFTDTGVDLRALLLALWFAAGWGILWLIRLLVWLVRGWRRGEYELRGGRALAWWGCEPLLLGLSVLLIDSGAPAALRFRLSAGALQDYVESVRTGKIAPSGREAGARRIGLYTVGETQLLADGVVRFLTTADGFDQTGFAHAPNSPPQVLGKDLYQPMHGPWWHWRQRF